MLSNSLVRLQYTPQPETLRNIMAAFLQLLDRSGLVDNLIFANAYFRWHLGQRQPPLTAGFQEVLHAIERRWHAESLDYDFMVSASGNSVVRMLRTLAATKDLGLPVNQAAQRLLQQAFLAIAHKQQLERRPAQMGSSSAASDSAIFDGADNEDLTFDDDE